MTKSILALVTRESTNTFRFIFFIHFQATKPSSRILALFTRVYYTYAVNPEKNTTSIACAGLESRKA